ncbi:MAG: SCO family protein [Proteobacteria bacterium]|nr:SCO family protein [Pseudomonadota bacterium]
MRERTLLDSSGAPSPLLGLASGDAAVVSFIYLSCPHACPMASATMQRLDRMLAEHPGLAGRVQLVSVSFDPQRDTPERMRRLERQLAPRGRWRFLTPPGTGPLGALLSDFGQDALSVAQTRQLRHVLKIFLVDDSGAIRNVYSTGLLDPRLIVNDLLTLRAETDA